MAIDKSQLFIDKRRSYTADPSANWEAGNIAALTSDSSGATIVTLATGGTAETPIGMFWGDKTTTVTKVEIETITFVDGTGAPTNGPIQLRGTSVEAGSDFGELEDGTDISVATGEYTLTAGGGITRTGAGANPIPAGGTITIRYRRNITVAELLTLGINYDRQPDDTLGNGLATVLQADTQVYTSMYDTAQDYAVNDALYVNAVGRVTTVVGTRVFGRVITPPNASNEMLEVEFGTLLPA